MATKRKMHVKNRSRHQDKDEIVRECEHSSFPAFLENPQEILHYLVEKNKKKMPPYLKNTVSNIVIFYHKDDRGRVEELKDYIEKKTTVVLKDENLFWTEDKGGIGSKFCFKEIGNKIQGYVSCCCCFIYVTEKFVKETWPQLSQDKHFKEALYDSRGLVVPVLPQAKGNIGIQIPMGLNQLRPLNYYRKGDKLFESSLNGLLADKSKMKQRMEEALATEQRKWVYNHLYPRQQNTYAGESTDGTSSSDEDVTATQDSGFSSGDTGITGMNFRNTFPSAARREFPYSIQRHDISVGSQHQVSSEHEDSVLRSDPLSLTSMEQPYPSITNRSNRQRLQSRGTNSSQEHSLHSMFQVPQAQPNSLTSSDFPSQLSSLGSRCGSNSDDNRSLPACPVNLDFNQIPLASLGYASLSGHQSDSYQSICSTRNHGNHQIYSYHNSTYRSGELNSSGSEQYDSYSSSSQPESNAYSSSPVSVDMDPGNFSRNMNDSHQPPISNTDQLHSGNGQKNVNIVINNPRYVQIGKQGVITSSNDKQGETEYEDETNIPVQTDREDVHSSILSQDGDGAVSETSCTVPSVQTTNSKDRGTDNQQVLNTQTSKNQNTAQSDSKATANFKTSNKHHEEKGSSTKSQHKDTDLRYQLDFNSLKPSSYTSEETSISMDAASVKSHKSIQFGQVKKKPMAQVKPLSVVFQNNCKIEDNDSDDLYQNHFNNNLRAPAPSFDDDTTSLKQAATQSSQPHQDNTEVKSVVDEETAMKTVD